MWPWASPLTPPIKLQAEQNLTTCFINAAVNEAAFPFIILSVMHPAIGKVSPLPSRGQRYQLNPLISIPEHPFNQVNVWFPKLSVHAVKY